MDPADATDAVVKFIVEAAVGDTQPVHLLHDLGLGHMGSVAKERLDTPRGAGDRIEAAKRRPDLVEDHRLHSTKGSAQIVPEAHEIKTQLNFGRGHDDRP